METWYASVYNPSTGGWLKIAIVAENFDHATLQARSMYGSNCSGISRW